jgi:hypothetical protein
MPAPVALCVIFSCHACPYVCVCVCLCVHVSLSLSLCGCARACARGGPGLSSFADHVQDVAAYLAPLLAFAAERVPLAHQPATPLYLLATAGLRLLPLDAQARILRAACDAVRGTHTSTGTGTGTGTDGRPAFQFDCHQARVLSGEAEGVFGWVTVNYLTERLGTGTLQPVPSPCLQSHRHTHTHTHLPTHSFSLLPRECLGATVLMLSAWGCA